MDFKSVLKDGLKGTIPQERLELLPSGYQRVGDIGVVFIHPGVDEWEKEIGGFVRKVFGLKSVFRRGAVSGEFRVSGMRRIAGRANTTVHRENGCLYKVDLSKLIFAKGNSFERGRVRAGEGERVVDMFAGIGYFTIPVAKGTPSCRVHAAEKNPVAVRFLKENIKLNRLGNVELFEGDCRDLALEGGADRILMGYMTGTEAFLDKALSFLGASGTIHYHNVYRKGELWRKPLGEMQSAGLGRGFRMQEVLHKRVVKQYSPCKYHAVVDARFIKT